VRIPDEARLEQRYAEDGELGRTAIALELAIARLRSRLREEAGMHQTGLSISQIGLLGRLIGEGPATAAYLASAEHVSQQAIAQSLTTLKVEGLVAAEPDPGDGRKTLLSATAAGRDLYRALHESRETWLIRAIETTLTGEERELLRQAAALLERLAAARPTAARTVDK
jgi:DNA-binding MarR family transcriptional regulator